VTLRPAEMTGQRGSAMVIAILVTAILLLLGMSFLLLGQTEGAIASNQLHHEQALYVCEAVARSAKRWFDAPSTALNVPQVGDVRRDARRYVDETDPYINPPIAADGNLASRPYYKQADDALFERPLQGESVDRFVGTAAYPDIRIDRADGGTTAAGFLDALIEDLLPGYPGRNLEARVERVDIYAPPYIDTGGGSWTRFGTATVNVFAGIHNGTDYVARRNVEFVVSELPYELAYAPLHSCGDIVFTGDLSVYWGPMTSVGDMTLSSDVLGLPASIPRGVPVSPRLDRLWDTVDATAITDFKAARDGHTIPHPGGPWFRAIAGGDLVGHAPGQQPYPAASPPAAGSDHSNLFQQLPLATCPNFEYPLWKSVATSGDRNAHYYRWVTGDQFRENGLGPLQTFRQITDGQQGFYFFDTQDGRPARDDDGDRVFDNLTPAITISGGTWNFRGLLYVNVESFQLTGLTGAATTMQAPAEPFQDLDGDGTFDPGEPWINLDYSGNLVNQDRYDLANAFGGGVIRNERGPLINTAHSSFHGIFFTNGSYEALGVAVNYGSVITWEGVTQSIADGSQPTPDFYWDASLEANWPPESWDLPLTAITSWKTSSF